MLASSLAAGNFLQEPAIGEVAEEVCGASGKLDAGREFSYYKIVKLLGRGGMGEVYLAEDTRLERKVALKLLPSAFSPDAGRIRRFVREAKAASALNHPNILTIYENGVVDDVPFIASEFVEGDTLRRRLKRGRLPVGQALDIAIQVGKALKAGHDAGIIHRDVKPDNVMIRPDGVVKLLDFGIAKLLQHSFAEDESTTQGTIIGTANYMSPEQARGKAVDARSDIFSLGLVLYEMLAGRKAFDGENPIDVISCILHKEPTPLSQLAPELPAELDSIVEKAIKKDREERCQTASELLNGLEDLQREHSRKYGFEPTGTDPDKVGTLPREATITGSGGERTSAGKAPVTGVIHRRRTVVIAGVAAVLAAFVAVFAYWNSSNRVAPQKKVGSIAVMPFANQSGSTDTEYLSDGMTETLISTLSRLPGLSVKSRSSVFAYKGKNMPVRETAKELNVQAIVNGSVTVRGANLTLYAEIVDAATESVLWSKTYDNQLSEILTLQEAVARDVLKTLEARLSGDDEKKLTKNYPENAEAYRLFLKGDYEWNKHSEASINKAIEYYSQALEKDRNYALAYTGLSKSYGVLGNNYIPPQKALPKAREYAEKALAIDDSLAEAHDVMGAILLYYDWDIEGAERHVRQALAIDPNDAAALTVEGSRLEALGRFDEALSVRQKAVATDPLSPLYQWMLGTTYYLRKEPDLAIVPVKQAIELDEHFAPAYVFLGEAYEQKGAYAEAIKAYETGAAKTGQDPKILASLAHAFARSGDRSKALETLAELRRIAEQRYVSSYSIAVAYAGLDDKEQALAWLERGLRDRSADMLWLRVEPMFAQFQGDPRFQSILDRIGVKQ